MAIDPPYRLDPLQNVVDVKWGDDRYLVLGLFITCSPTIEFQRLKFQFFSTDLAVNPGTAFGATTGIEWPWFATQFRWVWTSQQIEAEDWNGTQWTTIKDTPSDPIKPSAITVYSSKAVPSGPVSCTVTGLPSLPITVSISAGASQAAAHGPANNLFWPRPRWAPITGGDVLTDEGKRIFIPGSSTISFKNSTSSTISMRGISMGAAHGVTFAPEMVGVVQMYQTPYLVGFRDEGGPVIVSPGIIEDNLTTFGALNVSIGGIKATSTDGKRQWNAIGSALEQSPTWTSASLFAGTTGAVYVLCEKQQSGAP